MALQLASAAKPLAGYYATYSGNQVTTKKGVTITDRRFTRKWGKAELQARADVLAVIEQLKLNLNNAD